MGQLDRFRLDDRVVFIGGGGGAIGSAMAVAFAEAGARVAVVDVAQESVDSTATRVSEAGGECLPMAGDMTDRAAADEVVRQTVERFGRLDIVVNAIGGGRARSSSTRRSTPTTPGSGSTTSMSAARSCPRRRPSRR